MYKPKVIKIINIKDEGMLEGKWLDVSHFRD